MPLLISQVTRVQIVPTPNLHHLHDVSFLNIIASTWTLATLITTWESLPPVLASLNPAVGYLLVAKQVSVININEFILSEDLYYLGIYSIWGSLPHIS